MTPLVPPVDGAEEPPDLSRKPIGKGSRSWSEQAVPLPAAMLVAVAVDVYDGPAGRGYVVRGELVAAGVLWSRSVNVGPETYRDAAWRPVVRDRQP